MTATERLAVAGATLAAIALTVFAVSWLARPIDTSQLFGVTLDGGAAAYGRVKGAEDLLAAALIAVVVVRRDRPGLTWALWLALIVPAGDMLALILAGVVAPSWLAIHVVFIAVIALCALGLGRRSRARERAGT